MVLITIMRNKYKLMIPIIKVDMSYCKCHRAASLTWLISGNLFTYYIQVERFSQVYELYLSKVAIAMAKKGTAVACIPER